MIRDRLDEDDIFTPVRLASWVLGLGKLCSENPRSAKPRRHFHIYLMNHCRKDFYCQIQL